MKSVWIVFVEDDKIFGVYDSHDSAYTVMRRIEKDYWGVDIEERIVDHVEIKNPETEDPQHDFIPPIQTDNRQPDSYNQGWNECRAETLERYAVWLEENPNSDYQKGVEDNSSLDSELDAQFNRGFYVGKRSALAAIATAMEKLAEELDV